MGLFFRDDREYDEEVRQRGFNRYKQLMSVRFGQWWKVNLLTLLGCLPLAAGVFYAVGTASILVLYPCSLLGGMIAGPFIAGMYDAVLRGLRDDSMNWKDAYKRSWKQNWKSSTVFGAVMGLLLGQYVFMGMLFWWADSPPGWRPLLLMPVVGIWYIVFLSQFLVYERMDSAFRIEEQFNGAE